LVGDIPGSLKLDRVHPLTSYNSGWWFPYPSEKYEFVSWDDYSQYMEKMENIKNVSNHQPVLEAP
jgi:hypothetical protein